MFRSSLLGWLWPNTLIAKATKSVFNDNVGIKKRGSFYINKRSGKVFVSFFSVCVCVLLAFSDSKKIKKQISQFSYVFYFSFLDCDAKWSGHFYDTTSFCEKYLCYYSYTILNSFFSVFYYVDLYEWDVRDVDYFRWDWLWYIFLC